MPDLKHSDDRMIGPLGALMYDLSTKPSVRQAFIEHEDDVIGWFGVTDADAIAAVKGVFSQQWPTVAQMTALDDALKAEFDAIQQDANTIHPEWLCCVGSVWFPPAGP